MTPVELAWAAGIFEGEGSVRINSFTVRNNGHLLADMVNNIPEVTAFFAEHWGGYHRMIDALPPRRPFWRWRIAAIQAATFLEQVSPYFRTARYRERAALGIEYQQQKSSDTRVNRTPEYRARQLDYFQRMKALNVRGC